MKAVITDLGITHDVNKRTTLEIEWLGNHRVFTTGELEQFLNYEGGKMASMTVGSVYPPDLGGSAASVSVSDLWAVYPELRGACYEPEARFANRVRLAADLARKEDALVELRDRLEPIRSEGWDAGFEAAFGDVAEEGAGKDES